MKIVEEFITEEAQERKVVDEEAMEKQNINDAVTEIGLKQTIESRAYETIESKEYNDEIARTFNVSSFQEDQLATIEVNDEDEYAMNVNVVKRESLPMTRAAS